MDSSVFTTTIVKSFKDIKSGEWNRLLSSENPFLGHEFFLALENNGNLNNDSGWNCRIVCLNDNEGMLIAAMPMFAKEHSWAEFVFDWAWANAYHQHGLSYYPKLLVTIPYTPATANKFLIHPEHDWTLLSQLLVRHALNYAKNEKYSSIHALFLSEKEKSVWQESGFLERNDVQFHWRNEYLTKSEANFDDFLLKMTGTKRKKIRQERRYLEKQNIEFTQNYASEIPEEQWNDLYLCYANTFLQRGQPPYFKQGVFMDLAKSMGDKLIVFSAKKDNALLACSICFESDEVLYGRYWGEKEHVKNLHFELCYYQTIEYALKTGKRVIEPGTGGGHKLRRGFEPTLTSSMHWLKHDGFQNAIADFLREERTAILDYQERAKAHLPFKK